jgi:HEAT repeat protein
MIEAHIILGDADALRELASDDTDPERQAQAIEALGIVGADDIGPMLTGIYRDSENARIREAALHGLMIAGDDEALLELYRSATDTREKRRLLEFIGMTGSDKILEIVDEALAGGQ